MESTIRRLAPALGAEISGIDCGRPLRDEEFATIYAAWLSHEVLVLRDQALDEPALVAFSRRFGELERSPAGVKRRAVPGCGEPREEVLVISNIKENGRPIGGLGAGEAEWHTDMSYIETPPTASLLHAKEVPAAGGDTSFLSMTMALAAMPDALRQKIEGRTAKHDPSYTSVKELRRGRSPVTDVAANPAVSHPMICIHPATGKEALFLGRRLNAYVNGLTIEASEALLDEIWSFVCQPRFVYTHHWQPGDLVIWDNRSVMHRRDAFNNEARRLMIRTQVKGTGSVAAAA